MPKQSEIDRMLILFYRSNSAHDYTNFVRPSDWLDKLPMVGLEEFDALLGAVQHDVQAEIERRKALGLNRYPLAEYAGKVIN